MTSEEDKASIEDKKRRLKTPSQVAVLEEFYNEYKYPSEELKSEFASKLGLSEKQISRWFCHRRLKDKNKLKDDACLRGKNEYSSSVLQDGGSGPRQDSCGSTKQGDYMLLDPREVESQRCYGQDFPSAVLTSESRGQLLRTREYGTLCDTSSGVSSGPLDKMLTSRYSSWDSSSMTNNKVLKGRGYMMASEYLYLQDEIENSAISAVKKQLGRHYRSDGPPVGIEFQPLPPGAFDSPLEDPIHETYYMGDPSLQNSHKLSRVKDTSIGTAYGTDVCKAYTHGSFAEGAASRKTIREFDRPKDSIHFPSAQRSSTSYYHHGPDQNSVMQVDADAVGEASEFSSNKFREISQEVERPPISHKGSLHIYDRNTKTNEYLKKHCTDSHEFQKPEYFESGASHSIFWSGEPLHATNTLKPRNLTKLEDRYLSEIANEQNPANNPFQMKRKMKLGKELKGADFRISDSMLKMQPQEKLWAKSIKGFTGELPTSFSEDETASSSSSM